MTIEERFERVDTALLGLVESQLRQANTVGELMTLVSQSHEAADARMRRIEETLEAFIRAGDARMGRIEANLDSLIRAITAEHSNGKNRH